MDELYAKPAFVALDGLTYLTEEKARSASRRRLIRTEMCEQLRLSYVGEEMTPKQSAIEWFIEDFDRIITAYYASADSADRKLKGES